MSAVGTAADPVALVTMSRALNVNAGVAEVRAICAKLDLRISAIEDLMSGGTRVILQNGSDAESLRRKLKTKLITGPVKRAAWAAHRG